MSATASLAPLAEHAPVEPALLDVYPWHDPVVASVGVPVHDPYVEMFWLPILGPTATWLLRRLAAGCQESPDGYAADMDQLARGLGVSFTPGRHGPFMRALQRCEMFGAARQVARSPRIVLEVRTMMPILSRRHLDRLPDGLRQAHDDWGAH